MGGHTAYQPILPLADAELETFLQFVSSGALTLAAVQHALTQPSGQINVLKTLIPLYTSKVPWGGLAYHYSDMPINSLNPEDVFNKIVRQGRGGHCLEMVPLFASVLLGLGYDLYLTGARIGAAVTGHPDDVGFHGWSHLVLIVTIFGQKHLVDPQYPDAVEPVILDPSGPDVIFNGPPTTIMRLRYCALSEIIPHKASKSGLKTWLLEYKRSLDDAQWTSAYIFSTETEWYLEDLPVMNVWLAKATESYLVTEFTIRRLLLVGADDPTDRRSLTGISGSAMDGLMVVPEISGAVELAHDHLRVWRGGKKVIDETIGSEQERHDILQKWFGITLNEEEAAAILSRPSALRH